MIHPGGKRRALRAQYRAIDDSCRRIYAAVAAIPRGRVAGYGEIAARAGLPGRARLVGRALAQLPDGHDLPWHRVLRADGRIALPQGSSGFREQCRLLRAEGVTVRGGRVSMARFSLSHDLDRELWDLSDSLISLSRSNHLTTH